MVQPPELKKISQHLVGLVFCSFLGTRRNSQPRFPWNSAAPRSFALACSLCVLADFIISRYTSGGRAFWCLGGGSVALYAFVWRSILMSVFPAVFFVGSGLPLATMVAAT